MAERSAVQPQKSTSTLIMVLLILMCFGASHSCDFLIGLFSHRNCSGTIEVLYNGSSTRACCAGQDEYVNSSGDSLSCLFSVEHSMSFSNILLTDYCRGPNILTPICYLNTCNKSTIPQEIQTTTQTTLQTTGQIIKEEFVVENFAGLQCVGNLTTISFSSSMISEPLINVSVPADLFSSVKNVSNVTFVLSVSSSKDLKQKSGMVLKDFFFGIEVENVTISNLTTPFTLDFMFRSKKENNASCVFLNNSLLVSEGCETKSLSNHVKCSCNHFSYFALLLNDNLPESEDLTLYTYISCGISVGVFTVTLLAFTLWSIHKQVDQTMLVHLQLVGSLLLLNVMFLLNGTLSSRVSTPLCTVLGLLLHYFLLCSFTSLAVEGVHLYRMLIQVYNVHVQHYFRKMSLLTWGAPALVVAIITAVNWKIYGMDNQSKTMCWITNDMVRYITVLGYVGLVMLFNAAIFIFVVVKVVRLRMQLTAQQKGNHCRSFCSLLFLMCMLGLSWILSVFLHENFSSSIVYIFTVLNSLQGFGVPLWLFFKRRSSTAKDSYETGRSERLPE
ncbi:adhesion G-protein coupled receptor G5-like isoform X2 [Scleropages formosus]|uniref:Adhesion G-protein coupled receptor G5-like n=1 Tax=Scleropages formosus TaxID=113540 RepID=A0A8C9RL54_SCLFO|nr:adhesion G-protein coupled receptor G5-like isoform X2 [Scleropages formosus]